MKKVLVLCTGNSCRSQILEGWLNHYSNGSYRTYSAGVEAHGINKDAIFYMRDFDIDISNHTSDLIDKYCDVKFDLFVTVCDNAKESCPITPKASRVLHRNVSDPSKSKNISNAFRNAILELKVIAIEIDQLLREN